MGALKKLSSVAPLALALAILLFGVLVVMPQAAQASDSQEKSSQQASPASEQKDGSEANKQAEASEGAKSSASSSSSSAASSKASEKSSASSSSKSSESTSSKSSASSSSKSAEKSSESSKKKTEVKTQADEYNIWVQGIQVTSDNKSHVLGENNTTVVYDPEKKTLTLKKATLTCAFNEDQDAIAAIYIDGSDDITISLSDKSTIKKGDSGSGNAGAVAGIRMKGSGKLTFAGDGELSIEVVNADSSASDVDVYGIWSEANLTFKGKAIVSSTADAPKGNGKSYGVRGIVNKMEDDAVLTATGASAALNNAPSLSEKAALVKESASTTDFNPWNGTDALGKANASATDSKFHCVRTAKYVKAAEATCTTGGNVEYWLDTLKDWYYYYSGSALKITSKKSEVETAALGHKWGAWEELDASQHKRVCERCSEVEKKNHEFEWKKLDANQHQHICKVCSYVEKKENHKWDSGKVTKAATATTAGTRTYTCTVCNATKTASIPATGKASYTVVSGNGATWTKGTNVTLSFTFKRTALENGSDTTYKHFTGIRVDNNTVDKSNYTYSSGSVIIRLKPTYLEKLTVGSHKITALFNDNSATPPTATFTVRATNSNGGNSNTNGNSKSTPATGDNAGGIVVGIVAAIVAAIVAIIAFRRMRRS